MRILSSIVYGLLGYLFYQFIYGLRADARHAAIHRRLQRQNPYGAITGQGRGRDEATEELSGASTHYRVGRGAI